MTTARDPGLPAVPQAADVRALVDYRGQLVAERTALADRTPAELHGLLPGYHVTTPRLTAPCHRRRPTAAARRPRVRAQLTRRRLDRLAELTVDLEELAALIGVAMEAVETGLTAPG